MVALKKEEFMKELEGCRLPDKFDQHLLDHAAEMFGKWGISWHSDEREHLFETYGLASKPEDSSLIRDEKRALRCVITRMMHMRMNKEDASDLIRNFNKL